MSYLPTGPSVILESAASSHAPFFCGVPQGLYRVPFYLLYTVHSKPVTQMIFNCMSQKSMVPLICHLLRRALQKLTTGRPIISCILNFKLEVVRMKPSAPSTCSINSHSSDLGALSDNVIFD